MKNIRWTVLGLIIVGVIGLGIHWIIYLQKGHSSFENYYRFRGCTELVSKSDDAGYCKLKSGQTIKIVKFEDKWFLDGDLPCGFACF